MIRRQIIFAALFVVLLTLIVLLLLAPQFHWMQLRDHRHPHVPNYTILYFWPVVLGFGLLTMSFLAAVYFRQKRLFVSVVAFIVFVPSAFFLVSSRYDWYMLETFYGHEQGDDPRKLDAYAFNGFLLQFDVMGGGLQMRAFREQLRPMNEKNERLELADAVQSFREAPNPYIATARYTRYSGTRPAYPEPPIDFMAHRAFWGFEYTTYRQHTPLVPEKPGEWLSEFPLWHPCRDYGRFRMFYDERGIPAVTFTVPLWFLTVVSAVLAVWWPVYFVRHRRRYPAGHCQKCGYDLRATPERCPECGTAVS